MSGKMSLSKLLKSKKFPTLKNEPAESRLKELQLQILRIQQGIWHQKKRVIIVFEGFDAAGKGGAIRRITEPLDPRGYQVHPIGPPEKIEQGKHYLYRFWAKLPAPGTIAIFDRSWYGRVLVEKVRKLTPKARVQAAYHEICQFEHMLLADGIDLIKIFLAIDKKEQLRRFEDRLRDPYKQWKISEDDVKARAQWGEYVKAADLMLEKTSFKKAPWHLIPANDKDYARVQCLGVIAKTLKTDHDWMTRKTKKSGNLTLDMALEELGLKKEFLK